MSSIKWFTLIFMSLTFAFTVVKPKDEVVVGDVEALTLVERNIPRVQTLETDFQIGFKKFSGVNYIRKELFHVEGYWFYGAMGYQYHPSYDYWDDVIYTLDCCLRYSLPGQECDFATDPQQCSNVKDYERPQQLNW